ncbi:MAG: PilZ domain-containing protein [Desulfopila sp.]
MADEALRSSRRSALRFPGNDRPVFFRTDYEEGESRLVNISTGGCAMQKPTLELQKEQKVLLSLELDEPGQMVDFQAVVVRLNAELVSLQFLHVEEDIRRRLVLFFAREANRRNRA